MKTFKQKKSLGQHFIKDKNIVVKIVELAKIEKDELVWEIGPGKGILTEELLKQQCTLTCFEIDKGLYPILLAQFGDKINLVKKDILQIIWKDYLPKESIKIVANLPYQITSPFLYKVCENAKRFSKVVIMIQKEVAQRINAKPSTKEYGKLTLKIKFYFDVEYGFTIKPHVFYPKPKVDSAVIILSPRIDKPVLKDEDFFWKVVEVSFRNRRKMLRRNLREMLPIDKITELSEKGNIELTRRAESLSEQEFIELYESINELKNNL